MSNFEGDGPFCCNPKCKWHNKIVASSLTTLTYIEQPQIANAVEGGYDITPAKYCLIDRNLVQVSCNKPLPHASSHFYYSYNGVTNTFKLCGVCFTAVEMMGGV